MSSTGIAITEPGPMGLGEKSRDMLGLSKAGIPELISALEEAHGLDEEPKGIPRRSKRVVRLMMKEAIRLIRLGTRREISEAALELAQARRRTMAADVEKTHAFSARMLTSAADALAAASPPSSGGGEMTLLRSWNGKARQVVSIVSQAEGRAVPRADLRVQLDVEESYLSHLLAELEAAGLIIRVRNGRTVMVHLGLVGRSDHVQEMLPAPERVPPVKAGTQLEGRPIALAFFDPYMKTMEAPRLDIDEALRASYFETQNHETEKPREEEPMFMPGGWTNTGTAASRHFEVEDGPLAVASVTRLLKDSPAEV